MFLCMDAENKIREIAMEIYKSFGENASAMARAVGVKQTSLHRYIKEKKRLTSDNIAKILDYAGVQLVQEKAHSAEYVFVNCAAAKPSAGGGSLETSDKVDKALAFRREWLSSKTLASPDSLVTMLVVGDSMLPTISDGDTVLVDTSDQGKDLRENKIYVVRKYDDIYIKRFRKGVGTLLFKSDNKEMSYQDIEIKPHNNDSFAVLGRVLWAGREF